MEIKIIEGRVLSSDKKNNIYYKVYEPSEPFKGVFQVVHGMTEHIERYDAFMKQVANEGYLCFGHDHVGHGKTAPNDDELGFIASKDGDRVLVDDVGVVANEVKKQYDFDKRFLLGHSMGSFITRIYASEHGDELLGYICMGTGGSNPAAKVGLTIAKRIIKKNGERYVSPKFENIMFGTYNKRTENINGKEWLTKDVAIQEKYLADKFCTFHFTTRAMTDLINLLIKSNSKSWYENINMSMPIYLVSGQEDPVGAYGKGPTEIYNKLIKTGHTDVTLKLWEGDRHEVLNELDKEKVIKELLEWVKSKT